jgi:hypothetical protein
MVRYLVEYKIVHPRPVQLALPGVRIGDNPPALRARPPEDDASDMENQIDALKPGATQRAMEEPVQFVGLHETRHDNRRRGYPNDLGKPRRPTKSAQPRRGCHGAQR